MISASKSTNMPRKYMPQRGDIVRIKGCGRVNTQVIAVIRGRCKCSGECQCRNNVVVDPRLRGFALFEFKQLVFIRKPTDTQMKECMKTYYRKLSEAF